ncbi:MAG: class F sortase [Anaerolineales bacterium]
MQKRTIFIGITGLVVLWVVVFLVAGVIINQVDEAGIEALASPTARPIRTDVPELRAPTDTPAPETDAAEADSEATAAAPTDETPTETPEPTERPTAAFTLSALEINTFQSAQQEAFVFNDQPQPTLEPVEDETGGAYPIRLAVEELGLLASVVVVQTDEDFNIVTPREDVGYYALTPKIGTGGNSVMVGHVFPGRIFNRLLDVQVGQTVRITDERYQEHFYRVEEIIRFPYEAGSEEDRELGFEYMYDNSEERITLVTCYPEYEWTHRFVVRAVPIAPPDDLSTDDEARDG